MRPNPGRETYVLHGNPGPWPCQGEFGTGGRKPAAALLACLVILAALRPAFAAVQLEPVLAGLASPLYLTNARDGTNRLFIVEQAGRVKVLQPQAAMPSTFLDITGRVLSGGEQGLLGLAFHPQYAINRRFFLNYTRQSDGATVIAEYRASTADPNLADPLETVLLVIPQPFANHNGGMIEFGSDGLRTPALLLPAGQPLLRRHPRTR